MEEVARKGRASVIDSQPIPVLTETHQVVGRLLSRFMADENDINKDIGRGIGRGIDLTNARPVYVIGGGPGGLATAAALRERGVRAVVLEKSESVGASWHRHYDRLHLHTTRRLSALPGLAMPRSFGRWVARDDVIRYLETYAEFHRLEIVTGVEVSRIEPSGPDWVLHATGGRELTGRAVVVATGYNHTPRLPDWPGRESYTGQLLHAGAYRNAGPFAGKDVLVVGVGNTGAEIAVDLVEGGARRRAGLPSAPGSWSAACRSASWTGRARSYAGSPSPTSRTTACRARTRACTPG
jgi:NADPH-dependent 2,4-dienoyl-CoA reductase/sulfur reductase-like enzyme